jgi:uncharacterized protein (TIGR00251 family)
MKTAETKNGAIIEVFVKPSQPKFNIKIDGGELTIFCTEEPVKGKVNKEIIKELTKRFRAKVELVSGATSKQKRLLVTGLRKDEVEQLLNAK